MITVMKASAGSGKTYALAQKYIRMLLDSKDPREYRHILAVTFTNKATDEMKERTIKELAKHKDPRAKEILSDILHDYGSFAVSTIDKFFQQTLRAFARELGQFGRYQVELDKKSLVDEAVDTILDELSSDNPEDARMIDFIVENMEDNLAEGKALNIEQGLKEMARQLKSESFTQQSKKIDMDREQAYSGKSLSALKKTCRDVMKSYEAAVREKARGILDAMDAAGYTAGDFKNGWPKVFCKYAEWDSDDKLESLSATVRRNIETPEAGSWFKKTDVSRFGHAYSVLGDKLAEFAELLDGDRKKTFVTARMLIAQVYGLGVAARLFRTFDRIAKEKNVVCLDESNSLLRDIIDGSDAPFVYEKTGVRFRNFLLDEFQDISVTQWDNFLPLLRESQSRKLPEEAPVFNDLIVGDVKQSIYRWRESDWRLLDSQVEASFPGQVENDPLKCNWRSLKEIVRFNNGLYPYLAKCLDGINAVPENSHSVEEIYADCHQDLGREDGQQGGYVSVEFVEGKEAELERILETVNDLRDNHGATLDDIAILVRMHSGGTAVAQFLIEHGIPVVTSASLRVKNSLCVRRMVSMMSYVDNPEDAVGAFIARKYGIEDIPDSYHSLPDIAEKMYSILYSNPLYREECRKEVMYIASFMDYIMDYSAANGNNLHDFLASWAEKDPNVNTSSGSGAVSIITIHASKGLAFPYVILPFLEDIPLYNSKNTKVWAAPGSEGTALEPFRNSLYYVPLTEKTAESQFRASYLDERFNQGVDVINLLYVATTRAQKGMTLLADTSHRSFSSTVAKLLHDYCGGGDLRMGDICGIAPLHKEEAAGNGLSVGMEFPFYDIGGRLGMRPYAADFFMSPDNSFENLSYRERGIVLHDILSRIVNPGDLEDSVDKAVADGSLGERSRGKVTAFLRRRIASHPEFFPHPAGACGALSDDVPACGTAGSNGCDVPAGEGGSAGYDVFAVPGGADKAGNGPAVKIFNERSVIDTEGNEHRPDRVLVYPDGRVMIVDFKSGHPDDSYTEQIEGYRRLFREMGYTDVEAHLWFLYTDKVV